MAEQHEFELDIDRERVCIEGEWLSVDDLAGRIKQMIEAGDFHVSHLSLALEALETGLADIRSVEFKLTPAVLTTFERLSAHERVPIAKLFRRALAYYLASEQATRQLYEANLNPGPEQAKKK